MPAYPFLKEKLLDTTNVAGHLKANRTVGVPYTDEAITQALADMQAQADPNADPTDLQRRYPKAQVRDFDGDPTRLTEMDALVAYLQMLGTLVDLDSYVPEQNRR
jgi:cytochrome c oxidase cbb3-type subunit 2